jgi:TIR domain/Clp amino terminal domain, pathogenicity island component
MIANTLEISLHNAFVNARTERHKFISVEDLLLCLLDNPDAKEVLLACAANIEDLRTALTALSAEMPRVEGKEEVDIQPTIRFQRVIQRSIMHVQLTGYGKKEVTGANVLVAIFGEKDAKAVELLHNQGVTRLDVVKYIAHGIPKEISNETPEETFIEVTTDLVSAAKEATRIPKKPDTAETAKGLRLFISYSHSDTECLNRLLVHLKPLERQGLVDCWSDKKIRAGDKWKSQLRDNLDFAAVAILLVSADFLASDFIVNNELPPLLMKAEANGLRILPVILKPCGFHRDKVLQSFQAMNDPNLPLLGLSLIHQEALYDKVAEEVHQEIESRRDRGSFV